MRQVDSGLLVVIIIVLTMFLILGYCLLFVKYEWCHVLYNNNTVSYSEQLLFKDESEQIIFGKTFIAFIEEIDNFKHH